MFFKIFIFIEVLLLYNIIYTTAIQYSDSQFLKVYSIYNYYKVLAVFPVLYNRSL